MKITLVNQSDINGGAARAAYRIHQALRAHGLDSNMVVDRATSGDTTVSAPQKTWSKTRIAIVRYLGDGIAKYSNASSPGMSSPALFPSRLAKKLNQSDSELLHLHWLNGEMLSIAEIGRLHKPVVWTLHDMWAFCGAEHYPLDNRWKAGYSPTNRAKSESGFDLNRWTWQRKKKHWNKNIQIVTPSNWLASCVRKSALMATWPVSVIPNAIDTDNWKPINKASAREILGLSENYPVLLFGAIGGIQDPRKGFDLLQTALESLQSKLPDIQLLVLGQRTPEFESRLKFSVHYSGHLHDDLSLRVLYSAADAVVIPSRQDNLPNIGLESLACGTPVVAFDTGGLADIVEHQQTGFLARAFDTQNLAAGITWVIEQGDTLRINARNKAIHDFDSKVVAQKYARLFEEVISQ